MTTARYDSERAEEYAHALSVDAHKDLGLPPPERPVRKRTRNAGGSAYHSGKGRDAAGAGAGAGTGACSGAASPTGGATETTQLLPSTFDARFAEQQKDKGLKCCCAGQACAIL